MTDPIADMLTRIRNAVAVRKPEIILPYSKIKFVLAEILEKQGFVKKVKKMETEIGHREFDEIKIVLQYSASQEPAVTSLKRISKPGRRVYVSADKLPRVLNNLGIAIISTSQGLMTNKEARKAGLGGEVVCEIY